MEFKRKSRNQMFKDLEIGSTFILGSEPTVLLMKVLRHALVGTLSAVIISGPDSGRATAVGENQQIIPVSAEINEVS